MKLPGLTAMSPDAPKLLSDLDAIRADWETATGRIAAQL